jgi:hypothetical protein
VGKYGAGRQHARPTGGEFDRERQAIKPSAKLRNSVSVLRIECESAVDGGCAHAEERNRRNASEALQVRFILNGG